MHPVGGEVDPDHLQPGAVDVHQDGRLARADLLGLAELDRLPALEQVADQVGDGDLGEPSLRARSARLMGPSV